MSRGQDHEQPPQQQHGVPHGAPPLGIRGQGGKLLESQNQGLSPGITDAEPQVLSAIKIKRYMV